MHQKHVRFRQTGLGTNAILEFEILSKPEHCAFWAADLRLVARGCWLLERGEHRAIWVAALRLVARGCWLLEREEHCILPGVQPMVARGHLLLEREEYHTIVGISVLAGG